MTDRIKGLVVTLDKDIRDDDVQQIIDAIKMIKCVIGVSGSVRNIDDHINRVKIKHDLEMKIYKALDEMQ